MNKYRITREEYHNKYGVGNGPSFYIQQLKPFLFFWKRWSYVKDVECGWGACYDVKTKFNSKKDAESFIRDILCTGKKTDGYSRMIIETYNCNNI